MNVAFFLTPRQDVATLYDDSTLRQALEKMKFHGYSAIPVVTRANRYVGVVSEGDFLWYLMGKNCTLDPEILPNLEKIPLRKILPTEKYPPVPITATMPELLQRAMEQNFIPVVDDLGSFIGIVTRRAVMKYFYRQENFSDSVEN